MSLAERLSAGPVSTQTRCGFRTWLEAKDEADQKAIFEAYDSGRWDMTSLAAALQEDGCPVKYDRIRKHLMGTCSSCGPRS